MEAHIFLVSLLFTLGHGHPAILNEFLTNEHCTFQVFSAELNTELENVLLSSMGDKVLLSNISKQMVPHLTCFVGLINGNDFSPSSNVIKGTTL